MLLRIGRDISFLLGSVRSVRYLIMFVLLMLWGRVILIVIECALSATGGTDEESAEHRSSTTQIPAQENREDPVMAGDIENAFVRDSGSAQSTTHSLTTTRAHPSQFLGDDAASQFADIEAIYKQQDPTAIRGGF